MAEQLFGDNSHDNDMGQKQDGGGSKIMGDKLDQFLSQNEKERASTIYKQMQQMREESLCMLCNQFISEDDQLNSNLYML